MAKKVYISPSDQVKNAYAAGDTTEAIQCRAIAQILVEALKRCGFEAKTNVTDGMYARVEESNKWGADLHICIHTNAYNGKVAGTRIFCYKFGTAGHEVCKCVMATLAPITPGNSDGVSEYPQLYEERATNAPCCYIEVEFHDNPSVAEWIIAHKPEIAEAIAKGVCNYYKVEYVAGGSGGGTNGTAPAEKRYHLLGDIKNAAYLPTLEKLVKLGFLKGTGDVDGDPSTKEDMILNLGDDAIRLLVILDRVGVFD